MDENMQDGSDVLEGIAFVGETLGPFFLQDPKTGEAGAAFQALAALDVDAAAAEWPFADEAEALGLVISERSARRILDGEIAPVEPLINRVRIEGEADARPAARPAKAPAGDARGLRIAPEDLESFSRRVACAFSDLARDYYLESAVKPDVRVGKDGVHIRIPVEKLR